MIKLVELACYALTSWLLVVGTLVSAAGLNTGDLGFWPGFALFCIGGLMQMFAFSIFDKLKKL